MQPPGGATKAADGRPLHQAKDPVRPAMPFSPDHTYSDAVFARRPHVQRRRSVLELSVLRRRFLPTTRPAAPLCPRTRRRSVLELSVLRRRFLPTTRTAAPLCPRTVRPATPFSPDHTYSDAALS
ncbi:hypothetical protein Bbelb_204860 [Branchiostoma belcheri]|nr:hypothetical protein Bbelb_204860 [Branchiostoma belcheri]